jgi:hypothetical protein
MSPWEAPLIYVPCERICDSDEELTMYLARFSYDLVPANPQRAIEFIRREVAAVREKGLTAKLLVLITREHNRDALQFEPELSSLAQLDQFRQRGSSTDEETGNWMHAFGEIPLAPPMVEILRLDEAGWVMHRRLTRPVVDNDSWAVTAAHSAKLLRPIFHLWFYISH